MQTYIKPFSEISIADLASVGGKNASLGEMFTKLSSKGIRVPDGFAVTAFAFEAFLTQNKLHASLSGLMEKLDRNNFSNPGEVSEKARQLLTDASLPLPKSMSIATLLAESILSLMKKTQ